MTDKLNEIRERHDDSVEQSMGDLALDEIDIEIVPDLLRLYNETRADRGYLLGRITELEAQLNRAWEVLRDTKPHKCPKCSGTGWLQYNPQVPYGNTSSCGPWQCNVCQSGIVWETKDQQALGVE